MDGEGMDSLTLVLGWSATLLGAVGVLWKAMESKDTRAQQTLMARYDGEIARLLLEQQRKQEAWDRERDHMQVRYDRLEQIAFRGLGVVEGAIDVAKGKPT
jgi:hypothetical protein